MASISERYVQQQKERFSGTHADAVFSQIPLSASSILGSVRGHSSGHFSALTEPENTQRFSNIADPRHHKVIEHKIRRGENLGVILNKRDLDYSLAHATANSEHGKILTSRLKAGRKLNFIFDRNDQLLQIAYPISPLETIEIQIEQGLVINSRISKTKTERKETVFSGTISDSLYLSAQKNGMSITHIMNMVNVFGWDIDFASDIRKGDSFSVITSDYFANGERVADGDILAAEFTTQGKTFRAIRFKEGGHASYYAPNGESMLGTFLRTPVEFSRISSRFGKRIHPISKKWKRHKGVDYAAPRGTPIRVTADGTVISVGRKGGYGKTVTVRHAGRFSTLYAHMNGYAKGIRRGVKVRQGQTIGYIGSTGLATGPHLHYEFRLDGVHRNPLTFKTPKASSVATENLARFKESAQHWVARLEQASTVLVAERPQVNQ